MFYFNLHFKTIFFYNSTQKKCYFFKKNVLLTYILGHHEMKTCPVPVFLSSLQPQKKPYIVHLIILYVLQSVSLPRPSSNLSRSILHPFPIMSQGLVYSMEGQHDPSLRQPEEHSLGIGLSAGILLITIFSMSCLVYWVYCRGSHARVTRTGTDIERGSPMLPEPISRVSEV